MEDCCHPARALQCVVKHISEAVLPLVPALVARVNEEAVVICGDCGAVFGSSWPHYLDVFGRSLEGRNAQIVHQAEP